MLQTDASHCTCIKVRLHITVTLQITDICFNRPLYLLQQGCHFYSVYNFHTALAFVFYFCSWGHCFVWCNCKILGHMHCGALLWNVDKSLFHRAPSVVTYHMINILHPDWSISILMIGTRERNFQWCMIALERSNWLWHIV